MFPNKKPKTEPKHKPKLKSKTRPTSLTKPSSASSTLQQQQRSPVIKDYLSCITLLPTSIFTLIEFIDEGSFGQVFKAKHNQSQAIFAIKILTNISTQLQIQKIILEASILRLCTQCQYINRYYGSYYDYITKDIWLVLEHADYGSISNVYHLYPNILSQVTEVHIAAIVKMILNALNYLHSNNIIHRDIKAGNFLLNNNGKVQLCDFGTSTLLYQDNNNNSANKIGSPYWMSPEVVSDNIYTCGCDIWALGITCIELVEGNPPNSNIKPLIAMSMIPDKPCKGLSNARAFSNEFKDFIKKCLTYDYTKRPSSKELMQSEFITKYKDNVLHKSMMEFIALIEQYKLNKEQFSNIAEDSYINGDNVTNKNCSIRKALKFTDQSLFNISDTDENNTSVIIHNEEDLTDCAEYLNSAQKPVKPLQFIKCKEKELLDVNNNHNKSKLVRNTRNYLIGFNNVPKGLNDSIEQSTTQIMNNNPYSSKKNSTRRKSMFIQSIEYITNKKNKLYKQRQCFYPQMKLSNRNMLSLNNTKDEEKQESTSHKTNNKNTTIKHHKIYSISPGVSYITLNKQKTN